MKGNCYLFKNSHQDLVPWKAAFRKCQNLRANLLVVDDAQEQGAIEKSLTGKGYWIGYYRTDSHTKIYKDIFGIYLPLYSNWAPKQPDDKYGTQSCVSMIGLEKGMERGTWTDDYCENKSGFICKMKGNTYPQAPINDVSISSV